MTPDVQPPIITRYAYTWVQHPDGLYYGPPYPGEDVTLIVLEAGGTLGHRSVARDDDRYVLRHPEQEEPQSARVEGTDEEIGAHAMNSEEEDER
jgi:hypothetical protein